MMICPYSEKRIYCLKFGPRTIPPGPCCKCDVPNPIKAKYFHMPGLDDGERWGGDWTLKKLTTEEKKKLCPDCIIYRSFPSTKAGECENCLGEDEDE